jgi:hypothetical protein
MPAGELAVMWGVLHHLQDPGACLHKLIGNYPLIFIREPVRKKLFKGLELGHPLGQKDLIHLANQYLPGSEIYHGDHCVLIFYTARNMAR